MNRINFGMSAGVVEFKCFGRHATYRAVQECRAAAPPPPSQPQPTRHGHVYVVTYSTYYPNHCTLLPTLSSLLLHWCGTRFTFIRDNTVEMSLATLDLTHVLCECPASCLKGASNGHVLDDGSSLFSLAMAIITLSPILLMARGNPHPMIQV